MEVLRLFDAPCFTSEKTDIPAGGYEPDPEADLYPYLCEVGEYYSKFLLDYKSCNILLIQYSSIRKTTTPYAHIRSEESFYLIPKVTECSNSNSSACGFVHWLGQPGHPNLKMLSKCEADFLLSQVIMVIMITDVRSSECEYPIKDTCVHSSGGSAEWPTAFQKYDKCLGLVIEPQVAGFMMILYTGPMGDN